jgi:hypothetical protein
MRFGRASVFGSHLYLKVEFIFIYCYSVNAQTGDQDVYEIHTSDESSVVSNTSSLRDQRIVPGIVDKGRKFTKFVNWTSLPTGPVPASGTMIQLKRKLSPKLKLGCRLIQVGITQSFTQWALP